MAGDILEIQANSGFPFWQDVPLASTGGAAATITARTANHQIVVQKIVLSITTHADTKVFSATPSAGSPATLASHEDETAAAGVPSVVVWDFGPHGVALAAGANLAIATTATASMVGVAHIEGYQRLVGPVAAASTN